MTKIKMLHRKKEAAAWQTAAGFATYHVDAKWLDNNVSWTQVPRSQH